METTQWPAPPVVKHRPASPPHDGGYQPAMPAAHDVPSEHDHVLAPAEVSTPRSGRLILGAIAVVALLAALLLVGLIPRQHITRELTDNAQTALTAPVLVNTTQPVPAPQTTEISLPANLRPWQEVSIFARTTGYLKKFVVDISDQVKVGQFMAIIESPEVDQQLQQARAALDQAKAAVYKSQSDLNLAVVTYNRYEQLSHTNSVTAQDLDTTKAAVIADQANVKAAQANVGAAQANVQRLEQLVGFEKITAPFSGVVTGRPYDVGALINADPTTVDIKPIFKIAENDVLRVFVNVPQSSALEIQKNMQVKVTARELPGRTFTGTVMGTTNYLDPANRSLLTEVKVKNEENPDGSFALLPGMYVTVNIQVHHAKPSLLVPAPALVNNADGTQLAIVQDGKIHFVKIDVGQDFGQQIEITNGLKGDEQIVATPGERIVEGVAAQINNAKAE
jgi:RND family efflux transporter MFP subunit